MEKGCAPTSAESALMVTTIGLIPVNRKLLLHCLDSGVDEVGTVISAQLSRSDWDEVLEQAARHGILPLLCHSLAAFRANKSVPAYVLKELRECYLHTAWRNTRRYHELGPVLKSLQELDIPVLVLKGAALAETLYESIALRPMNDVDLLIRHEDIWKIDELLAQKYRNEDHLFMKYNVEMCRHFTYTNGRIRLQFHTRIPGLPELNAWANAVSARIASVNTLMLGLEDFLLHLCVHLDQHLVAGSSRLIWCYDIAGFLKHYGEEIDWNYVIRTAEEHQVVENIHRILRMINKSMEGYIPSDVLSQFEGDDIGISIDDMLYLRESSDSMDSEFGPRISSLSQMTRMRFVFKLMFPSRQYMMHYYPVTRVSLLIYPYYFVSLGKTILQILRILHQFPERPTSLRSLIRWIIHGLKQSSPC